MSTSIADLPTGLERHILRSLRIPLAIIDPEFRFLWLNREMARIYQTQPEKATGGICYQLVSRAVGPCCDCPVVAVQKSGRREISQKYKDLPNGTRKYGEVSAFPVCGPQKEIVATLVMVMDITEKVVVSMNNADHPLAQWMSSLPGMMRMPPNGLEKERSIRKGGQARPSRYPLTRRETQVLHLLAKGHSNTRIAAILEISPHTVKSHVISIFNKLGVNDRIQAAVVATKQHIIE
jgi:DNA-binding CsgD family transcriptional regulator